MKKRVWKRLAAICCAASLVMTMPGPMVLADPAAEAGSVAGGESAPDTPEELTDRDGAETDETEAEGPEEKAPREASEAMSEETSEEAISPAAGEDPENEDITAAGTNETDLDSELSIQEKSTLGMVSGTDTESDVVMESAGAMLGYPVENLSIGISCGYLAYSGHNGYDLATPANTPVYAMFDGTATYKQTYAVSNNKSASYGNYIIIDSSDGVYQSKYCHLNSFAGVALNSSVISCQNYPSSASKVRVNTITVGGPRQVRKGEVVGYTGSTGNSSGPHLHLELKINGSYVNPASHITNSYSAGSGGTPDVSHSIDGRYSTPAKAYARSTGRIAVYDVNGNPESNRWIDGGTDLCTVEEAYTDGWCKVTYPTSGQPRTAYVPKSDFFIADSPFGWTADRRYDAYRRSSGGDTIGSVYAGDGCVVIGTENGRTQVIYPTSSSYKIGWIDNTVNPAPGGSSQPSGSEMTEGNGRVLPDGDYQIVSAADVSYYLDVEGTDLPASGGTNVSLCGPNQGHLPDFEIWSLSYSDGFYTIRQKGTNMCLDVAGGDQNSGANIQLWESNGTSAQKWAISWFSGHKGYRLKAKCSGHSMDIIGASLTSGTNVQQHESNDSDAQCWLFIPYEPARTVADGRYVLISALNPKLVLDISGDTGNVDNGTNVQVWNDSAPSRYNSIDVQYLDHGYYRLTHAASGKSLDVSGSSTVNTANIQLYTSGDQLNQKWAIMPQGGGYGIWSRCSGLVMDVEGGATADGTNVRQHYYNGTPATEWRFVQAEHTVRYDANGGSGAPGAQTKYYGNPLTLSSAEPTRSGYVFKGWSAESQASAAGYQPGDSYGDDMDVTLYAVWEDLRVTEVSLSASSLSLKVGETRQLTATVSPSDAPERSVTWTSSDASVARVDGDGHVTAVREGNADITVTTRDGGKQASCRVTVTGEDISGYSLILSNSSFVYDGKEKRPEVTVTNGTDTLSAGTDYAVSYADNKKPGAATVTINGLGRYTGEKEAAFLILPKAAKITSVKNKSAGIAVEWGKCSYATGYFVYRNRKRIAIVNSKTFSYTDKKAVNGETYEYIVCAYKTIDGSRKRGGYANKVKLARLTTPKLSSAVNSASRRIKVTWKKNSKATGYQVRYKLGSAKKTYNISSGRTVSKVMSGLKKGKTYKVYMRSYKTVGGRRYYSAWSASKQVTVSK